jgi:predicted DNA-binding transcriptional regulator AlpA
MKREINLGSGLYSHLDAMGVLSNGSVSEIEAAKREYWKLYRKNWKKNKRQQNKTYVILFSFNEQRLINRKASALHLTASKFIRYAALNNNQFPGPVLIGQMREAFILLRSFIEQALDNAGSSEALKEEIMKEIENHKVKIFSTV